MVLTTEEKRLRANEIIKDINDFMVLDTRHIKYQYNNKKFELAIELLNMSNSLHYGNEVFTKLCPEKQIQFNILFDAIGAVIQDKPLTIDQLVIYYKLQQEIEDFANVMENYTDLHENFWHPEIDLILLGFSLKEQQSSNFEFVSEYTDLFEEILNHNQVSEADILKVKKSLMNKISLETA